ncbi:MAG: hypothetical protein EOO24_02660 [Comamonadaceae bacterium]|nr:MAG: hypothetical protein EOO24_02660 [Comamonadaceae bacterium]
MTPDPRPPDPSTQPCAGFTPAQISMLFTQIVHSANVLARMAAEAASAHGIEAGYSFQTLRHLAERTGTLAELPIEDEDIVVGVGAWCIGSQFEVAGRPRGGRC